MAHSTVVGLYVYCKNCSHRFELGPLNAREVPIPVNNDISPFEVGWLCRCDHCEKEFTYQRADFVS